MHTIHFTLNGQQVVARDVDPNTTLLNWLRDQGRTGTKEGCAEGECGACAVALLEKDGGGSRYVPVNSCLLLLGAVAGREVITVEGVRAPGTAASLDREPHEVQKAMIEKAGSQCGYCTPGFVVSLFAEYYRKDRSATGFDKESVGGNLCRCTGYRPIVDAGRSLPVLQPGSGDEFAQRLESPPPPVEKLELAHESDDLARFLFRPTELSEALDYLAEHPDAYLVSGGTDIVVELNQRHRRLDRMLLLEGIEELQRIERSEAYLEIGAGVSLGRIEAELSEEVPLLGELLPLFSSRLIRARATLGGNLGTASPIGDSPPALLALDAELCLAGKAGTRWVPLCDFFTGYRKTLREKAELITSVRIPLPQPDVARFYKVSKRELDDISTVAAGFALRTKLGVVESARLAYGGVAATPIRATAAEQALIGQRWGRPALSLALPALETAFTPMSDQRGSAGYRQAMVGKLLEKFWFDSAPDSPAQSSSRKVG
ncbi:MAG: FAD binding domain-containing protein [Polyangiaceae bacterium]|nr:FAD binding domain-containing protein [Polyangiaceae bacterium]